MLWGIDPLLTADLLYALRRMGHGDEIVVVDTNFPAELDRNVHRDWRANPVGRR